MVCEKMRRLGGVVLYCCWVEDGMEDYAKFGWVIMMLGCCGVGCVIWILICVAWTWNSSGWVEERWLPGIACGGLRLDR